MRINLQLKYIMVIDKFFILLFDIYHKDTKTKQGKTRTVG